MIEPHVDEGWPADPENEELARLAEQLPAVAPPLPPAALARVEKLMQAELDRAAWRSRWRRIALGWSVAAAILLAVAAYAMFRGETHGDPALVQRDAVFIEDRITIAVGGVAPAPAHEKPLLRLDDYRSLFTD